MDLKNLPFKNLGNSSSCHYKKIIELEKQNNRAQKFVNNVSEIKWSMCVWCVCVCWEKLWNQQKKYKSGQCSWSLKCPYENQREKKKLNIISQYRNATIMKTTCLYTSTRTQPLSPVQLHCEPMDCSLPGSSIHGIPQAGTQECVSISFNTFTKIALTKWQAIIRVVEELEVLKPPCISDVNVKWWCHFAKLFGSF